MTLLTVVFACLAVAAVAGAAVWFGHVRARTQNAASAGSSPSGSATIANQRPTSAFFYEPKDATATGTVNLGPSRRQIPQTAFEEIAKALRRNNPAGPILINTEVGVGSDCAALADRLAELLAAAPNLTIKRATTGVFGGLPFRGIAVVVRDKAHLPESVQLILDSFRSTGNELRIYQSWVTDDEVDAEIIITHI